uniref:NADH-ubiquinone oxidoreductase chain 4L n=1 Tax=Cryptocelis alba TaxID=2115975 RepID=A0A2R3SK29_9PLAT|nr:NADH dehydrogenase subunit 4L [Cryptocelis alba]
MVGLEFFYFLFFLNLLLVVFRLKSILVILFAFEFIIVNIFFLLAFLSTPLDSSYVLIFLAIMACEASIGLTLMVSILRQGGNDNVNVSSSLAIDS